MTAACRERTFGWHFTGPKLRDGSRLPPVGKWEVFKGELRMCSSGLHVGITPWDALQYAPGETLRFVEYAEVGEKQRDKIVCRKRRTIAQMDATKLLRYFARLQAISCIDRWKQEPPDVVLDYLATGDETIRAAASAAAWDAASAAAWAAASAAAWDAASAAASAAAKDAAWAAAKDAAKDAASAAAKDAAKDAAWDTASAAAWAAARAAAKQEFNALVYEIFEEPMRRVRLKP